ncbi:hypothetical protein SK128_006120, partial [Halocaridina rubra]
MSPKRKADFADGSASKKRKAIAMEVKLEIVKYYGKGNDATHTRACWGDKEVERCSSSTDEGITTKTCYCNTDGCNAGVGIGISFPLFILAFILH